VKSLVRLGAFAGSIVLAASCKLAPVVFDVDAGPAEGDANVRPDAEGPVVASRIFVGRILSMDAQGRELEAVAVDGRGVIVAVGTRASVVARTAASRPVLVQLGSGEVLLPGFIEPHLHLVPLLQLASGLTASLAACRPAPYAAGEACFRTIAEGITSLKARDAATPARWHLAVNVDPSRQPYDATTPASQFKNAPASFLARDLSSSRPTVLVDQSGHLAYVNRAAFDALELVYRAEGKEWPPKFVAGGAFVTSDDPAAVGNARYTGLVQEEEAIAPFAVLAYASYGAAALPFADMAKYVRERGPGVVETLRSLRAAGITTAVSIADDASSVAAIEALVGLPEAGVRASTLVFPAVATKSFGGRPLLPTCDPVQDPSCRLPRSLGVTGIKMTADGSTQGCSAGLVAPVLYASGGDCAPPTGRMNFSGAFMYDTLLPLWRSGLWRFETHTNGNGAIKQVTDTYARLQQTSQNPHRAVLIHATVGDESAWKAVSDLRAGATQVDGKAVPALDVRMTHLIGHVAYWGAAFERQLGAAAAANIDPTGLDRRFGIPFTFHSDATITPARPLWFVQQAVTRETWTYPALTESHVLGTEHRIDVMEALRAITSRAAEEKEIERWVGSIEVGKTADFVVLDGDPLALDPSRGGDPRKISELRVVDTYLGGERTAR